MRIGYHQDKSSTRHVNRHGIDATAARTPMTDLRSGDHVLTLVGGAPAVTRVFLTEHVAKTEATPVRTLHHAGGSLTVTPDHAIELDGVFAPARAAHVGSKLTTADGAVRIERVVEGREGIINPVTLTGTILAADNAGTPVPALP